MYEKAFKLEIITPERVLLQADVTSLGAPGVQGGFQILYNHAPFVSTLDVGVLKVKDREGRDTLYSTSGGFAEVKDNQVVVIAETAEPAGEIDVERAMAAKKRAEERLRSKNEEIDAERARIALMKALNRLRVSGKA